MHQQSPLLSLFDRKKKYLLIEKIEVIGSPPHKAEWIPAVFPASHSYLEISDMVMSGLQAIPHTVERTIYRIISAGIIDVETKECFGAAPSLCLVSRGLDDTKIMRSFGWTSLEMIPTSNGLFHYVNEDGDEVEL